MFKHTQNTLFSGNKHLTKIQSDFYQICPKILSKINEFSVKEKKKLLFFVSQEKDSNQNLPSKFDSFLIFILVKGIIKKTINI
jgi:hypothetical protein